jgi:hypothetical protein
MHWDSSRSKDCWLTARGKQAARGKTRRDETRQNTKTEAISGHTRYNRVSDDIKWYGDHRIMNERDVTRPATEPQAEILGEDTRDLWWTRIWLSHSPCYHHLTIAPCSSNADPSHDQAVPTLAGAQAEEVIWMTESSELYTHYVDWMAR